MNGTRSAGGRPHALARLAATAAVTIVASVVALARAGSVELEWRAPSECPSQSEVVAEVTRLLGPDEGDTPKVRAVAEVRRDGDVWRVMLRTNSGRRALEAPSCKLLGDATALILALMIDPAKVAARTEATVPPVASSPASAGPPVSSSAAPAVVPPPPPPASAPSAPTVLTPLVGLSFDAGTLPKATLGARAGARISRGIAAARVGAGYHPGATGAAARPDTGGAFSLAMAELAGCVVLPDPPADPPGSTPSLIPSLSACGGVSVERVSATGVGIPKVTTAAGVWPAAIGAVAAGGSLGRLHLALEVGGAAPLVRRTFVIEGLGPVHTVGMAFRSSLLFGVHF